MTENYIGLLEKKSEFLLTWPQSERCCHYKQLKQSNKTKPWKQAPKSTESYKLKTCYIYGKVEVTDGVNFKFPLQKPNKIPITTMIYMKPPHPITQKLFKPEGGQIYRQQLAMAF